MPTRRSRPTPESFSSFADGEPGLRFVDQRMFGGLSVSPGGAELPPEIAHIGRDPFDPEFDLADCRDPVTPPQQCDQTVAAGSAAGIRNRQHLRRRSALGGSGALRADRPGRCRVLKPPSIIDAAAAVMRKALDNGGTSFDALYVNVNGSSGYFDRSLAVYGREGLPCLRCGTSIRREPFMNRSSYRCPHCQRAPRGFKARAAIARAGGER